jgi:hypothetical protein
METITKFVSGFIGGGAVSSLLLFVFKGQNKKIADIEDKKTDKALCKTIHHGIEKRDSEIQDTLKEIKLQVTGQTILTARIVEHLGIKQ